MAEIDPTAWAQARLPKQDLGTGLVYSALAGAKLGQIRKEREQEAELKALTDSIINSYKMGDNNTALANISQMARIAPEKAATIKSLYDGQDRTNLALSAYNIVGAFASQDPEVQSDLINQAINASDAANNPNNPLLRQYIDILETPAGPQRDAKMMSAIQLADIMKLFPEDKYAKSSASATAASDKLAWDKEKFETEQAFNEKQRMDALKKMSPKEEEEYLATEAARNQSGINIGRYAGISARMQKLADEDAFLGGVFQGALGRNVREFFKKWTGLGDQEATLLFKDMSAIRVEEINKRTPGHPISDNDTRLAASGTPEQYAKPEQLASWTRGLVKSQIIENAYNQAKLDYYAMRKNKGEDMLIGFDKYWDKTNYRYVAKNFGISEKQLKDTLKKGESIPLDKIHAGVTLPELGQNRNERKGDQNEANRTAPPPRPINRDGRSVTDINYGPPKNPTFYRGQVPPQPPESTATMPPQSSESTATMPPQSPESTADLRDMQFRTQEAKMISEFMDPDGSLGIKNNLIIRTMNGVQEIGYLDQEGRFISIEIPPARR